LFPKVAIEERAIKELAARYRRPKQSTPVGLLDDPIVEVSGSVVGWIGIGTAERLAEDGALVSTVDDKLATTESLWSLLAATRGPSIKQADAAWQLGRGETPFTPSRGRRVAAKTAPLLLPPRRTPRAASAA
jgi:hypothetical protein